MSIEEIKITNLEPITFERPRGREEERGSVAMINVQVNDPLKVAIADAKECALASGMRYAVVIGYDDYDRLCWSPVPVNELCANDEPVFMTENPVCEDCGIRLSHSDLGYATCKLCFDEKYPQ